MSATISYTDSYVTGIGSSWGGFTPGAGCTVVDPSFADTTAFTLASGSPCIDTGTANGAPATDLLGVSRPQGAGVDMGCYEYSACGNGTIDAAEACDDGALNGTYGHCDTTCTGPGPVAATASSTVPRRATTPIRATPMHA
jgi:hypothetical protein